MSSASSLGHSGGAALGGYARKLAIAPKSNISIYLDNHYHSRVYTTGSEVSGHVTICPQNDTRFDTLQVVLLGTTKTRVETVNFPRATSHTFLKLIMPIPESAYPVPRVFEAGMTYTVPFTFIIPSTLTLNACSHQVTNNSVREHHMRLPPTLGSWEKDDFAPYTSRIQYAVKARVYSNEAVEGPNTKIMEAGEEIKVLPAVLEDPPLNIAKHDDLYTMLKSKTLRKTIISPKSGKATVTATQPSAAMLSPDGQTISSTTVPLDLQFVPSSSDTRPPKVTGVTSKITAVTYFSAGGTGHYPNLKNLHRSFGSEGRGSYSGTTSVPTGPLQEVKWSGHVSAQGRRDSGYGSDGFSSDSEHAPKKPLTSPVFYTAQVQVPIQLPTQKRTFVPTFHSCITSRVYVLWLTVTLVSGGSSAHLTVGVPLQIGVSPANSWRDTAELPPSFEEVEEADLDEFLTPHVPTLESRHNAALPGYSDLDRRWRTVAAH